MSQGQPPRGRPRDVRVDSRILDATRALLREGGYGALTIEAVAARANVGKAGIYRRYTSKAELAFAATIHDLDIQPPPDSGSLEGDLLALAMKVWVRVSNPAGRSIAADLIADLDSDPSLRDRFRRTFIAAEEADIAEIMARALRRGELSHLPSPTVLHLLIVGPLFAAAYGFHVPLDQDAIVEIVAVIASGLRAADAARPRGTTATRPFPSGSQG